MNLPKQVLKAVNMLEQKGYEAFVVGGSVRDFLLCRPQNDFDVATNAAPDKLIEIFNDYKLFKTGATHGTVTVIINSLPIEITTYRIDGDYSDNRRPDSVSFTNSIKEDLARRDFTMNAVAYNPKTGFLDPFGGIEDIKNKIIKTVGNPKQRFEEDSLRILRALRFCSVYGFEIEENTAKAIVNLKALLLNISLERIMAEFIKTLSGENFEYVIKRFFTVFEVVIPEIHPMAGFDQKNKYHIYDVLTHSAKAVSAIDNKPYLKLAAFFHDIGKPQCFTIDENGMGHFYGHPAVSVSITENVLKRLKIDNETKKKVLTLIKYHDSEIVPTERVVKRWLNRLGEDTFFDLLLLKKADISASNPEYADNKFDNIDTIKLLAEKVIEEKQCFSLKDLAVNGNDLLELGFEGKQIGEALNDILNGVIDGRLKNNKDELIEYLKKIK